MLSIIGGLLSSTFRFCNCVRHGATYRTNFASMGFLDLFLHFTLLDIKSKSFCL